MRLEYIFRIHGYIATSEFVGRLRTRMEEHPNSVDGDEAKILFDELKHIAVRMFELLYAPQ